MITVNCFDSRRLVAAFEEMTFQQWRRCREHGTREETLRTFFGDIPHEGFEARYRKEQAC